MELGAVYVKVVSVSVTYPRPDHCKREKREIGRLEPEVKNELTGICLKSKNGTHCVSSS